VAALRRLEENGLSGYSGGTAQAFDLLPFSPSYRGAPRRNDETVTQEGKGVNVGSWHAVGARPILSVPRQPRRRQDMGYDVELDAMLLYRPVGLDELRLIYETGMKAFPPRLPEQPIFYPVLHQEYAEQIARDWNTRREPFAGYVTRFSISDRYAAQFEAHQVGGHEHVELWVPANELPEFNKEIESAIAVEVGFFGDGFRGEVPPQFMLAGRSALEQLHTLSQILEYNGMDFVCEVAANHRAIFLNFAYWLCCRSEDVELSSSRCATVIEAVRGAWAERNTAANLPALGKRAAQ
jgi:hypothetical protein